MVDARARIGFCLAAAGLIVLSASLSKIDMRPGVQPSRNSGDHPIAALAWSQAHCGSNLMIHPGTPRLQADDLLDLSAAYDSLALSQGHEQACAHAGELAATVATPSTASNTHLASARTLQSP